MSASVSLPPCPLSLRCPPRRRALFGLALAVLFCGLASPGRTQTPPLSFETISTDDGLSLRAVVAILQDRHGFMWFGTSDGLNRYDGYRFTIYRHDPTDPQSLSNSTVTCLLEDRHGQLWVGTSEGGLNRFDPATETFQAYRHAPDDPSTISSDRIRALYEDRAGNLWIGSADGLNRFDPATETFVRYTPAPVRPDSLNDEMVSAITEDAAGRLWIGTADGLHRLDTASGHVEVYRHPGADGNRGHALRLEPASQGGLWVGWNSGGLDHFDPATETFTHYGHGPQHPAGGPHHTTVRSLLEDRQGQVWFGTYGHGLRRLDPATGTITSYRHNPDDARSLPHDLVYAIHEDRGGVLWFGTWAGGLGKAAPALESIHRYVLPDNAGGDPPHLAQLAEGPAGTLWAATWEEGLLRLDRTTGAHRYYRHDPTDPTSIASDEIIDMVADRQGRLWLGLWVDAGLDRFDPATGTAVHYRHDPADPGSLSDDAVNVIHADRRGTIWVGTRNGGLNRYDPAADAFVRYRQPDTLRNGTRRPAYIEALADGADGLFWVGSSNNGLACFDPERGRYIRIYRHHPDDPTSLRSDAVNALHVDRRGRLWIGLSGQGLARFDPESQTFTHFDERHGLANAHIHNLLEDEAGHLWMSTNQGLSRFDPATKRFTNYDLDPTPRAVLVQHAALRTTAGDLLFGQGEAFYALDPDRMTANPYVPQVALTRLERTHADSLSGLPQVDPTVYLKEALTLTYKDRILTFEVAALSYYYSRKNRYAYRLTGFSDQWIDLGTERRFSFTNLDPGTYTLAVRGSNNYGVWSRPATLKLQIAPPWWRTGWAYLIGMGLTVALVLSLVQSRIRRIDLQNTLEVEHIRAETLRELDEAKSRFFANVSHEFRTPLTLIIGPLEDLLDSATGTLDTPARQHVALAVRNGRRLLHLVNQLLDVSRLESGRLQLQVQTLDLGLFARRIGEGFRPLAERQEITFHIEDPEAPCPCTFDPEQMEKVIANLLGNAFKFTEPGGIVRLSVEQAPASEEEGTVRMAVQDTGIGIAPDHLPHLFERFYQVDASPTRRQSGTGIGLALVHHLVALHQGEVTVASEVGAGTTFTVTLPLADADTGASGDALPTNSWSDDLPLPVRAAEAVWGDSPAQDGGPALPPAEDQTTVLVVDDHADVRRYIRDHLTPTYRVVEAATGQEALALARRVLPDLIVSDVMMPELDGYGLCRAVRQDPELDFIPVILLTAKASENSKLAGLDEGADAYLTKPFNVRELKLRVANLLAARHRLKAHLQASESSGDGYLDARAAQASPEEDAFSRQLRQVIETHLADEGFGVNDLAAALNVSRSTLYRRIDEDTSLSPMELLWTVRLERAAALLAEGAGSVSEVAYAVGFKSVSHFGRRFREVHGVSPSAYARGERA